MALGAAKEAYKEKISAALQDLSQSEMEKIIKMIQLVKKEFLPYKSKSSKESFKKAQGAWKKVDVEAIYEKIDKEWKNWNPPRFV